MKRYAITVLTMFVAGVICLSRASAAPMHPQFGIGGEEDYTALVPDHNSAHIYAIGICAPGSKKPWVLAPGGVAYVHNEVSRWGSWSFYRESATKERLVIQSSDQKQTFYMWFDGQRWQGLLSTYGKVVRVAKIHARDNGLLAGTRSRPGKSFAGSTLTAEPSLQ